MVKIKWEAGIGILTEHKRKLGHLIANEYGWFGYAPVNTPLELDRHDLLGINLRMREANDAVQIFKDLESSN